MDTLKSAFDSGQPKAGENASRPTAQPLSMKHFLICFLPVFLLDIFTWRDIAEQLGEDDFLYETSLHFNGEDQMRDSVSHVSDFLMNKGVFTGLSGGEYIIINRENGKKELFSTGLCREQALMRQYSITLEDLSPPPWYAGFLDLMFYPYNFIYYSISIVVFLKPTKK